MTGVEVNAVIVDDLRQAVEHRHVPVADAVVTAADELDGWIGPLHQERETPGLLHVVLGAQAADLPAAVHLVAEAPVANAVRPGVAVLATPVRPVRVAPAVRVPDPGPLRSPGTAA